jgi:transcriptional regulator GlxA family with amidase domain
MARNVGILIFDDIEVLDFAGPFEVFNVSGELIEPSPFTTYTIGISGEPIKTRGGLSVDPPYHLDNCPQPDILIVPGGWGTRKLLNNEMLLQWLRDQSQKVEYLMSVCTGALLLGKAGLLDGLSATTHHGNFADLREISPTTTVIEDQRYVDNGKILTAGGVSAGIDLSLYLVERLVGRENVELTWNEMEYQWHLTR